MYSNFLKKSAVKFFSDLMSLQTHFRAITVILFILLRNREKGLDGGWDHKLRNWMRFAEVSWSLHQYKLFYGMDMDLDW